MSFFVGWVKDICWALVYLAVPSSTRAIYFAEEVTYGLSWSWLNSGTVIFTPERFIRPRPSRKETWGGSLGWIKLPACI